MLWTILGCSYINITTFNTTTLVHTLPEPPYTSSSSKHEIHVVVGHQSGLEPSGTRMVIQRRVADERLRPTIAAEKCGLCSLPAGIDLDPSDVHRAPCQLHTYMCVYDHRPWLVSPNFGQTVVIIPAYYCSPPMSLITVLHSFT